MIVTAYGHNYSENTYKALEASDISSYLKSGYRVALKPNLVVPGPASNGAVTHPGVVAGVIEYLRDFGISDIKIIESSWVGADTKKAFEYCDYLPLSGKYNVPLIDLKDAGCITVNSNGLDIKVCCEAVDTDFLINIPVLKAHCQTRLTCAMKNLKGCIPDSEKRRFHTLGIHKPVAVLNTIIRTGYCVVDGICGDLTFEEGGNPVVSNRIIAGRNPLTVDSYCAGLIGYHPDEIEYLSIGKTLGIGDYYSSSTRFVVLNRADETMYSGLTEVPGHNTVRANRLPDTALRYQKYINEEAACSACYSSLVFALHRLGGRINPHTSFCIGQGFKNKTGQGIGIGNCTRGFSKHIAGCPPSAADIVKGIGDYDG